MTAILPTKPILESINIELDPKNAQINIEEHLDYNLRNKVYLKCTSKGNFIIGDIKKYYRQPYGRVNTLTAERIMTVYTLIYTANSINIKENDIIYQVTIFKVTPNEIIFQAKNNDGIVVINGTILPSELPNNFQQIYHDNEKINVHVLSAVYNKGQNYIQVTGKIVNSLVISESFRKLDFHGNSITEIESQLYKGEKFTKDTYVIENLVKKTDFTKNAQQFYEFILLNSSLPNELTMTKDELSFREIMHKIMYFCTETQNFYVTKDYSAREKIIATIEKYTSVYQRNWISQKSEKQNNDCCIFSATDSLQKYIYTMINDELFPQHLIVQIPINMRSIDALYIYLLTGIYMNVSLFIPEIYDPLDNQIFLICIRRVSNVSYKKLKEFNSLEYKMFKNNTRPYEYLNESISNFLTNYKQLRELFLAKHEEISTLYNFKIPSQKATNDPFYIEKEEYTAQYINKFITEPKSNTQVNDQSGGGDGDSVESFYDEDEYYSTEYYESDD
jgi:hypothetical protein